MLPKTKERENQCSFQTFLVFDLQLQRLLTIISLRNGKRAKGRHEVLSTFKNRDLKHRQRNGTRTTGESKIFPRERSAHVRCCQNVVQPSSTTESEQVLRSGENVSKQLNFYMLIIIHFHLLM